MSYQWEEDFYERERGRAPPVRYMERERERDRWLAPQPPNNSSLYRTRSVGHSPAPNVHVYNYNRSDFDARSPSPSPYARGRSRSRSRVSDEILDEVEGLRRDLRRQSRSPAPGYREQGSPGYYQNWQLEHIQRDADDRLMWERSQNQRRLELQRLRDRISREEEDSRLRSYEDQMKWRVEREKLKAEAKAQQEKIEEEDLRKKIFRDKEEADRKAREKMEQAVRDKEDRDRKEKAERDRAIKDWKIKQEEEEQEKKDAAKRAVEAYERKKKQEKEEEDALKLKFKLQAEREKEEEKEREREWELKQAKKKDDEAKKKKEEEEAVEYEMRKRLGKFGLQENQIEAIIDPKKIQGLAAGAAPSNALTITNKPTYIKIHKDHLSIETLKYYGIPYEWDSIDRDYIIILQEMSTAQTDILFEHSRRLKKPTQLFIEDRGRKNEPQYAWVRKPARSKSRHRARSPALFGPF